MIRRALAANDGVQSYAAEQLGLSKSAMQYKMKKYQGGELEKVSGYDLDVDRFIPADMALTEAQETVERGLLQRALRQADGIQAHAAAALGIDKQSMQYKLKKYGFGE